MTSPDAQARLKITRDEMVELFGEAMPIEAFQLLADAPADWTLAQVRQKLRDIAATRTPDAQPSSTEGEVERLIQCAREYEAAVRLGGEFVPLAKKRLDKARAAIAAQVTKP